MQLKQAQAILAIETDHISLSDYIDIDDIINMTSIDEVTELLDDNNAFHIEIIYFNDAMDYLKKNDPSLQNSLIIAREYGYELDNLSSEKLASLLASQEERDSIRKQINSIL